MSLMLGALHDALLKPGDPELARKAAEEVAGYERALAELRTDVKVVQALLGVVVAGVFGLLWLVLRLGETLAAVASKVGVP